MSVINKMLRDLEQQQQRQHSHGPLHLKPRRTANFWLWLVVPAALLAGWCGQAWFAERSQINTTYVAGSSQVEHSQLSPLTATQEITQPAELSEQVTSQASGAQTSPPQAEPLIQPYAPADASAMVPPQNSPSAAEQSGGAVPAVPALPTEPNPEAVSPVAAAQPDVAMDTMTTSAPDDAEVNAATAVGAWEQESVAVLPAPVKPRSLAIEKVKLSPAELQAEAVASARKAETSGQWRQALQYWQQASQYAPAAAEPYLQQARLWQQQSNLNAAEQVLQQGREAGANDPVLLTALAGLAVRQQRWAEVLILLNSEPEISAYPDFYALKATALQKTNQHAPAVTLFQQLARLQPEQARWWLGMALSYDALVQPAQALLAYRQAAQQGHHLSADSLTFVRQRIAELE